MARKKNGAVAASFPRNASVRIYRWSSFKNSNSATAPGRTPPHSSIGRRVLSRKRDVQKRGGKEAAYSPKSSMSILSQRECACGSWNETKQHSVKWACPTMPGQASKHSTTLFFTAIKASALNKTQDMSRPCRHSMSRALVHQKDIKSDYLVRDYEKAKETLK